MSPSRLSAAVLAAGLLAPSAYAAGACMAQSPATAATVLELYTSEGCNSCPPADRWLSRAKDEPGVVALAFHVDYWDRLGWTDRFGSAAYTQRQAAQAALNGARFSYTPQVVVDGVDRKDWPVAASAWQPARRPAAAVMLTLVHDGEEIRATVQPAVGAPARLAAYWAVTENGHVSAVKAGENAGVTLKHDRVVREYRPVPAWATAPGAPVPLRFTPSSAADAAHPRSVTLVVVDPATGRPLQAVELGC